MNKLTFFDKVAKDWMEKTKQENRDELAIKHGRYYEHPVYNLYAPSLQSAYKDGFAGTGVSQQNLVSNLNEIPGMRAYNGEQYTGFRYNGKYIGFLMNDTKVVFRDTLYSTDTKDPMPGKIISRGWKSLFHDFRSKVKDSNFNRRLDKIEASL